MGNDDLTNRFKYHPPNTEERRQAHERVRGNLLVTAQWLERDLPAGRELSLALSKLEEAMFWANAAIARQSDGFEVGDRVRYVSGPLSFSDGVGTVVKVGAADPRYSIEVQFDEDDEDDTIYCGADELEPA